MKKLPIIIVFILLFSFLNIKSINTIDSVALIYEKDKMYEEDFFNLNFFYLNVKDIPIIFNELDIEIISIKPEKNLYNSKTLTASGNNYNQITYNFIKNYSDKLKKEGYEEQSYYYEQMGFKIESMKVRCLIKDLIELENRIKII